MPVPSVPAPARPPSPPPDLVDFETGAEFLGRSGHPISSSTLRRLARTKKLTIWRRGRRHLVSLSDLLVAHGEWITE
ncbi:hypothetical protein [Streptomyces sp. CC224B]|uniref:hypothetical protein n=1 Tax=Streptomyces sp. CC224B TaxID=3044571 RepID=UPI0024A9F469|nr:hypothetical protein [Streptomyces sp. CC224B]